MHRYHTRRRERYAKGRTLSSVLCFENVDIISTILSIKVTEDFSSVTHCLVLYAILRTYVIVLFRHLSLARVVENPRATRGTPRVSATKKRLVGAVLERGVAAHWTLRSGCCSAVRGRAFGGCQIRTQHHIQSHAQVGWVERTFAAAQ